MYIQGDSINTQHSLFGKVVKSTYQHILFSFQMISVPNN